MKRNFYDRKCCRVIGNEISILLYVFFRSMIKDILISLISTKIEINSVVNWAFQRSLRRFFFFGDKKLCRNCRRPLDDAIDSRSCK